MSGYVAPLKQDAEIRAMVERINTGRAEKYQELADGKSIPWRAWRGENW